MVGYSVAVYRNTWELLYLDQLQWIQNGISWLGSQSGNSHFRTCASGCYMVTIQFGWVGTVNVREALRFHLVEECDQPSQDNWDFHKQLWLLLWNYLFGKRRMLRIFSFSEKTQNQKHSQMSVETWIHTKHRSPQNKQYRCKRWRPSDGSWHCCWGES